MKMRVFIVILLSLCATGANADTPWYGGAGIGVTHYDDGRDLGLVDISKEAFGFQIFAGYEITPRWAVEVGYTDLGSVDDTATGNFNATPPELCFCKAEFETKVAYINGQYHIPLGDSYSLDLSLGWGYSEADFKQTPWNPDGPAVGPTLKDSTDDSGLIYGVGLTLKIVEAIYLRPSFTIYDFDYASGSEEAFADLPWRVGIDLIYDF